MNKKKRNRKRRYDWMILIIILIMAAGLLFFLYQQRLEKQNQRPLEQISYQKHYAFIAEDYKDPFWNAVYQAADQQGREKGIYVEMTGSQLGGSYSVEQLLAMAIAAKVDGIIVNPVNETTSVMIAQAASAGIDVVTILNDVSGTDRVCFVGIGNYKMGQEYGKIINKVADRGAKRVLILIDSDDRVNQNFIYSSICEALKDQNLELKTMMIDRQEVFGAEEAIRNIVLSPDQIRPDLLVCLSSLNTICAYQSVVDFSKVGQIQIVGYYGSDSILEAIEKQIVNSVIMVDSTQLGSWAVEALDEFQERGRVNEYIIADTKIIDQLEAAAYRDQAVD